MVAPNYSVTDKINHFSLPQSYHIDLLNPTHLHVVDDLGRKFRNTIGFLTRDTIKEYLSRGRVLGALDTSGHLIGYLMFADYEDRIRIAQLCVCEMQQGNGIAKALLNELMGITTTQKVIKLKCRRDFQANSFWPKAGFIPFDENSGRSAQGHPLTTWCYPLTTGDELGLWKAQASDNTLNVVIDAQIFFDFYEPDTDKSLISKGMLSDFLSDSLSMWITDELFVEIARHDEKNTRAESRHRAHGFNRIEYNRAIEEKMVESLKTILPYDTPNKISDIKQLAKTAASDFDTFVTRDSRLLNKSEAIESLTGLTITTPTELVLALHKDSYTPFYAPSRVSGLHLKWQRITTGEFGDLNSMHFKLDGEKSGRFNEKLQSFLASPDNYQCEILKSEGISVAIRILSLQSKLIEVPFARIMRCKDTDLFASFLVADTLSLSVSRNFRVVIFPQVDIQPVLHNTLVKLGFFEDENNLVKPTLTNFTSYDEALPELRELISEPLLSQYEKLEPTALEKCCAPLVANSDTPCFLIPIRPNYAMQMIDHAEAADDLFGGNTPVLLRWDNVYYRAKSHHLMLKAPGRIVWYVSGRSEIIAISHLEHVEIAPPKQLFRKYSKFGVLEWDDLFRICGENIDKEIMALRFSHTYPLRKKITLKELRDVCGEDDVKLAFPSPTKLPHKIFEKLYNKGYLINKS